MRLLQTFLNENNSQLNKLNVTLQLQFYFHDILVKNEKYNLAMQEIPPKNRNAVVMSMQ